MTADTGRPNVVIIYADDLGWGDLGCFGAEDFDTPALDGLAASGVRLPQWYSNSPVCSPSRASLLTGRHPAHAGVESILGGSRHTAGLPPQPTLAGALGERGYATGIFGKWHLGVDPAYGPLKRGFDEHFGFLAGCVDYYSHIYYWGEQHNPLHDLWEGEDEVWLNGEYLTTVIARRAADFIERNAERPFFCYVPFNAPHYPMHAPEEYVAQFAHLPEGRQMMAAMVKAMDDGIAHVLGTLDSLGLRENTIVFFSSDNGPSVEERNWLNGEEVSYNGGSAGGLRGHKGSLLEGGIRVPTMISWPARLPAVRSSDLVGFMADVVPTVLEAVDGAAPADETLDGSSVLPLLAAGEAGDDRWLFWKHDDQLAARHGRWKIVLDACDSLEPEVVVPEGLYDLHEDPGERHNLAAARPERFGRMRAELTGWAARRPS
ncbi:MULTISPECIES: sulfatase-like hydrolase/transferase [Streptomyces]|uniref:sulfatase-like hydrolase/transferase n=1 Tax=Streptomyces TaxID=1883 RepID=UPI0005680D2A|nr:MULTISPECIES: sulfatase-like hydrolase/transferase [Streptomyces]MBZ6112918.1 sulfatase-like hydrolase/transferase [Streptomyces olivaceus]MBZ6126691.1 sulfatase-like hydrolase/transferase [Streptomyces olivaceus]MBZ6147620.1 sulfatase-like hydrolase/transferase [Streptomyces olivaceus]MBZ6161369.1 sulfatase-like hydrolase/transferase [Streptomyces olivaceus]MBZ6189124.1 sulfatase-like hydrolase/transferase [Streptomyces olivaceus]